MKGTTAVLLSAAAGVIAGWVCGDELRRRKNAEAKAEDLRQHIPLVPTAGRQLKEIRGILNDAHKHILAVSKALQKPAS